VVDVVDRLDAAGVGNEAKVIYLAGISALSAHPISIDVNGPSGVGKTYLVLKVLQLFPEDALYVFTTASSKVFFYDSEDSLRHKIIYAGEGTAFYAANKGSDEVSTQIAALIRQLQSDSYVVHKVTRPPAVPGDLPTAVTIRREGPISLMLTSTQELHSENTTRNLIVRLNETPEQTRVIIDKRMTQRMESRVSAAVDLSVWHDLHCYLALGATECVVPYARSLGRLINDHHMRIRRDVDAIVSAIEMHALIHQHYREQDEEGRWIATLDDYAAIQPIFNAIFAQGREDVLSPGSRRLHADIVERIQKQIAAKKQKAGTAAKRPHPFRTAKGTEMESITITGRQLAADLGISQSSVCRYLQELYDLQLIKNVEARPRQPLQLRVLDDPPEEESPSVMPTRDAVAAIWAAEKNSAPRASPLSWKTRGSVVQ
jgi:hypothetical protein